VTVRDDFSPLLDRVGAPIRDMTPPYVTIASEDAIRHFARAYGDGNPLFSDPAYATSVGHAAAFAPPLFPLATGSPTWNETATEPDTVSVDLDRAPGVRHQTIVRDHWILCRPIVAGTRLARDRVLAAAALVPEGAHSACDITERTTYHAGGETYAVYERHRRYRLEPAPANAKPQRSERTRYSPEELAAIDAAYRTQEPRGATPRHLHTVSPGDRIAPMVKGPLTVTDLVEYRSGVGPGPLGGEALRLSYLNRMQHPERYGPDDSGALDITERRHWDDTFARSLGYPGAYDDSHTRLNWLAHLLTDWMGDGGWVRELAGTTTLADNFVGDAHWLEGTVTEVTDQGAFGIAAVSVWGTNQLGTRTCEATALVVLPAAPERLVSTDDIATLGTTPLLRVVD
jgi:acyl dehydratase